MNEEKNKLINEITKNRIEKYEARKIVRKYRDDLESFKIEKDDFRNRTSNMSKALEKTKSMAEIIKIDLELSKAIDSSIKLEFELREKQEKQMSIENDNKNVDIREIHKQLKKLNELTDVVNM